MFHLDTHPDARKVLRSRLYLLGLIFVFIGPLIASVTLYHNPQLRTGLGNTSHGTLILPPRPVEATLLRAADQSPRWTLMYRASASSCSLQCEAALFMMRQVRQSLASKRDRTQLLVVFQDHPQHLAYREVLARLGPHRVINASKHPNFASFIQLPEDSLFLADPLGNLLMYYPPDTTSRGLLSDIKRLLTASRIG